MSYDAKFMALKDLPSAPQVPAGANYILSRIDGRILTLSGNGPLNGSTLPPEYVGRLGNEVSTDTGYKASRLTCMNLLLAARTAIGSLDVIDHIIGLEGMVNSTNDFTDQPKVINGCSDLLVEIFGEHGKHTRSALGTNVLAFNICVEISMTIKLK